MSGPAATIDVGAEAAGAPGMIGVSDAATAAPATTRGRDRWVDHFLNKSRIYRGLAGGCARFPLPLLHLISLVCNTIAIALMRRTIHGIRENMRTVGLDEAAAAKAARAVFHGFGHMMIDIFRIRARGPGMVPPLPAHARDDRALRRLPDPTRGCLLVTGHLGNWELGGIYLVQHGFRLAEVGQPELDPDVHVLRSEIRSRSGIEWIEIGSSMGTALRVREAIERGVHVALLADRPYADDHIVVDFFGRPTPFLRSPVRLARFCGVPIVPAYLLSNHDHTYRSWFGDPLVVDPDADPDVEDARIMGEVAKVIERGIREDPGQWYNFYDYWGAAAELHPSPPP